MLIKCYNVLQIIHEFTLYISQLELERMYFLSALPSARSFGIMEKKVITTLISLMITHS